jgi:large subunit ribosomal protein L4
VHVVDTIVDGDTPSTKTARRVLAELSERTKPLVVLTREDEVSWKSLRNLPEVHVLAADQLNAYDVLCADDVVFTTAALTSWLAGQGIDWTATGTEESA